MNQQHLIVSKLSERLSNINTNDQITLNPDKNALLNKGKFYFKKGQLVTYTLNNAPYMVEILIKLAKQQDDTIILLM